MYIRIQRRKLALIMMVIFSLFCVNNAYYYQYNSNIKSESIKAINKLKSDISTYKELIMYQDDKIKEMINVNKEISDFYKKLENAEIYDVTAYDLSFQSTGKYKTSRGYGITYNGTDIRNKSWVKARTIAVDIQKIPIGSTVYVRFTDKRYSKYNGIYVANDIGSAIKNNHIDLFHGDYNSSKASREALRFGIAEAKVIILK